MPLHGGIDTVAVVSGGVYSATYGAADQDNINNLFVSYGLIEDAPSPPTPPVSANYFHYQLNQIKGSDMKTDIKRKHVIVGV